MAGDLSTRRHGFLGSHELKFGMDYVHDNYDGRTALLPVTIVGVSNFPLEQINFGPASRFGVHEDGIAWFAADKWQPIKRLTIDLGLRLDRDSITDSVSPAPRAGFALMLTKDAKTVLKGGADYSTIACRSTLHHSRFCPAAP